uniref:Uncharacterized protein n=1 Tax=Diplonema ambulator TaxID=182243 RepID=A0A2D2AJT1_9EUGL|nr:hypothetical protein [Diplonema ambulator]
MLYHHVHMAWVLLAAGAAMSATMLLACVLRSSYVLVHECSTYDAGIASSHHAASCLDVASMHLLWYMLVHECYLLWICPQLLHTICLHTICGTLLYLVMCLRWWA